MTETFKWNDTIFTVGSWLVCGTLMLYGIKRLKQVYDSVPPVIQYAPQNEGSSDDESSDVELLETHNLSNAWKDDEAFAYDEIVPGTEPLQTTLISEPEFIGSMMRKRARSE